MAKRPSIARLREVLNYNPETGILTWRINPAPNVKAGDQAGSASNRGYIQLKVDNMQLQAHRVIFAMVKGRWPKRVDHEDTDGFNNRWTNLRLANPSQNGGNRRTNKNNKLGLKGVYRHRKGFRAQVKCNGQKITIGTFPTPEQAHAAYVAKATELFGKFARAS